MYCIRYTHEPILASCKFFNDVPIGIWFYVNNWGLETMYCKTEDGAGVIWKTPYGATGGSPNYCNRSHPNFEITIA